jgi:hypothetical protein
VPSVRARHLKTKLEVITAVGRGDAVLEQLGRGRIALIEKAHGLDWLPIEVDLATTRAAHAALGADGAHALWSAMMSRALGGPLFAPIARAGLALLARDAATWSDLVGKGWTLAFRQCGRWSTAARGPRELDMRLEDLPPECARDTIWLTSVASALSSVHAYLGVDGAVVFTGHGVESRSATFHSVWSQGGIARPGRHRR